MLPQHLLHDAERHRRERTRWRAGHQADEEQGRRSPARSQTRSRRYRRARWPRAAPAPRACRARVPARCRAMAGELADNCLRFADVGGAVLDVLAEKIGMDLLADAQPGPHQRDADLGAAEPHDLDIGRERGGPGEIGIGQRDDDDRQQRERLPDRLQQDDRDEIARRPVVGQLRAQQVGGRERRESERPRRCADRNAAAGRSTPAPARTSAARRT